MTFNIKRSLGIPMGDATQYKRRPKVTLIIIALNIAVYAVTSYTNLFLEITDYWVSAGGFVPSLITMPSQWYRVFASMFLHADFFHILFNMYFLYLFGRAVENALGGLRYLTLYLISGIAASVFHITFSFLGSFTAYVIPAIGASGAISGVLGAYLMLYPGTSLVMGWGFFLFPLFFRVKAAYYLIFWFATQLIYGYARLSGSTAVFAHAGGFIAGIALLAIVANKERINQLRLMRHISFQRYLIFVPSEMRGLSNISKAIIIALLALLLIGTVYASIGLTNQGSIKSATIQYTCEGTPYMDYLGVPLTDIESQLSSISLDTTRILLSRLYAAELLYSEANADEEVNLSDWNVKVRMKIVGRTIDVNLTIDYFKGKYDSDGFLSYGEGNLTTQTVLVYQYGYGYLVVPGDFIRFIFGFNSQTVNLTNVTQYTGLSSLFATIAAIVIVIKKDKELVLIGEEPKPFRRFDLAI